MVPPGSAEFVYHIFVLDLDACDAGILYLDNAVTGTYTYQLRWTAGYRSIRL
jgi:hypothetical protein